MWVVSKKQSVKLLSSKMNQLSKKQRHYKNIVVKKIKEGVYKQIAHKCPCGGDENVLLATEDRYGIPLRTVLCKKCGLVRADPYFDQSAINKFYLNEYRGLHLGLRQMNKKDFKVGIDRSKFIINYLRDNYYHHNISGKTVFEIGCGSGATLYAFSKIGNDVYGCDFDAEYIKFGKGRGLPLYAGGIEKLLSLRKKADLVLLIHVLEHFLDPVSELKKIRRLLNKNGILFVAVPGIYFTHRSYNANFGNAIQAAHAHYFTLKSLTNLAQLAGFRLAYGDESAFAIFQKGKNTKIKKITENYKDILDYFKVITRFRFWYIFVKYLTDKTTYVLQKFGLLEITVRWYHAAQEFLNG